MGMLEKVTAVSVVLHLMTWKGLLKVFIAIMFGVIFTLFFMNFLVPKAPTLLEDENVKLLTVTDSVKNTIADITRKSPIIVGTQIITLNFHKNIRVETYMNIGNVVIQQAYDLYMKTKRVEVPLFTIDKEKNNRIFSIINGEFTCTPYKESMAYKYAPQLDQVAITDVCSLGIPPYNNNISGLISVYLKYHPSSDEKQNIFLSMREVSNRIYRDSFP